MKSLKSNKIKIQYQFFRFTPVDMSSINMSHINHTDEWMLGFGQMPELVKFTDCFESV